MKLIWHSPTRIGLNEITGKLPSSIDIVPITNDAELSRHIEDAEIAMVGHHAYLRSAAEIYKARAKKLRWMQFRSAGIDTSVPLGLPKGPIITYAPGMSARPIAEHVMGMALMFNRRFHDWRDIQKTGVWDRSEAVFSKMGCLAEQTIVVIGYGHIGQVLCQQAKGFGMATIVVSRGAAVGPTVDKVYTRDKLDEAVAQGDVVAMCTALSTENYRMMGKAQFAKMKRSAYYINISRGQLNDEVALYEACRDGVIAGAGLDATDTEPLPSSSPLWGLKNVLITPHTSGRGSRDNDRFAELMVENVDRFLAGKELKYVAGPEQLNAPGKAHG